MKVGSEWVSGIVQRRVVVGGTGVCHDRVQFNCCTFSRSRVRMGLQFWWCRFQLFEFVAKAGSRSVLFQTPDGQVEIVSCPSQLLMIPLRFRSSSRLGRVTTRGVFFWMTCAAYCPAWKFSAWPRKIRRHRGSRAKSSRITDCNGSLRHPVALDK